jgi:hypothetical protein
VTANYFRTLGVRLAAGRGFVQSRFEDLSTPELAAVIGYSFAAERFGDPRAAIGEIVKVNGVAITIVGVAPPRFNGAMQADDFRSLWLPLSSWQLLTKSEPQVFSDPAAQTFEAAARLQPDVSVNDARPAVAVVAARADADSRAVAPRTWNGTADVIRLRGVMDVTGVGDDFLPTVIVVSSVALLILLVCTTTVNSLLVGAALARR